MSEGAKGARERRKDARTEGRKDAWSDGGREGGREEGGRESRRRIAAKFHRMLKVADPRRPNTCTVHLRHSTGLVHAVGCSTSSCLVVRTSDKKAETFAFSNFV